MADVSIRINADDVSRLNRRISQLLHDTLNLEPVMEEAAQYMQRATVNRILRTKTGPDGERWAALSEVTRELKGHDKQLFQSGELSRGIAIEDVNNRGFMITSTALNREGEPYSSYMQDGVRQVRGAFRSKRPAPQVPARPFMGFSDENIRRISKMIRDYLARGGD